jgi:AAA domain
MNARGTWNSGANGFSNFTEGDRYDAASMDSLGKPIDLASRRNGHDAKATIAQCIGGGDFLAAYKAISYTIEGLLPSGFLYGLTARRGGGKTAWLITVSLAVMTGRSSILGREVERGRVAYIVKENSDDFRMKLAVNCFLHGVDHAFANQWLCVLDGRNDTPEAIVERLKINAEEYGPFQLVCYDTFQAGYAGAGGEEFNDNASVLKFILRLRPITEIIGKPSVLLAFHPTKNAGEEDLVPYGGGSIMNEIDGNCYLWVEDGGQIKLSHNRVRGPEFEPQYFRIEKLSCPNIVDSKNRQILLPAMRPCSQHDAEQREKQDGDLDIALLKAVAAEPDGTQEDWGKAIGRTKGPVNTKLKKLGKQKFVEEGLGRKWKITAKGRREISP